MKTCGKCGDEKPEETFSRDRRSPTGRYWCCKECHRELAKVQRERHRAKRVAYDRAYNKAHPEKMAARVKRYAERNPDLVRARKKDWREANPEKRAEAWARWRAANPDYYKNNERRLALARKWNAANPDKVAATVQRRRAAKYDSGAETINRQDIWQRDNGICGICHETIDGRYHIDHIVPLALGGAHAPYNVQVAHPSCNQKKWITLKGQIGLPM